MNMASTSAAYPPKLAQAFAQQILVLIIFFFLSPKRDGSKTHGALWMAGVWGPYPIGLNPQSMQKNMFVSLRNHWITKILDKKLHHQIVGHFQQQKTRASVSSGIDQRVPAILGFYATVEPPIGLAKQS